MDKPTCTTPGCDKTTRARGLCSTHYNQAHAKDRHCRKLTPCVVCGTETERAGGRGRKTGAVCSTQCRAWLQHGHCALPADHWARWYGKASTWTPPPQPVEDRDCTWCGQTFTPTRATQSICTLPCKTRAKRCRRRAREHSAPGTYTWAEVTRIWLDICKVCAYCHEHTTDIEPDHVVPLNRGGSNSITNVVPSCQRCNGDKRDLMLTEWEADRTRRGLVTRSLHPTIKHLTQAMLIG